MTEDADIGIRLAAAGANIKIIYDEAHATREETPNSVQSFIKQRTRWNQGFLQIFLKNDWTSLPTLKQKTVAAFVLLSPELQAAMFIYSPFAFILALTLKLPVIVAMLSFLPVIALLLQLLTICIGLYEFCRAYRLPFNILMPIDLILTFVPYQILLSLSAFRACFRFVFGFDGWEKTLHLNAHRKATEENYVV